MCNRITSLVLLQAEKLQELKFKECDKLLVPLSEFSSSWNPTWPPLPTHRWWLQQWQYEKAGNGKPYLAISVCWYSLDLVDAHHWLIPLLGCYPALLGDIQNTQLQYHTSGCHLQFLSSHLTVYIYPLSAELALPLAECPIGSSPRWTPSHKTPSALICV